MAHGILEEVDYVITLASVPAFKLPTMTNVTFIHIANEFRDIGGYIKGLKVLRKLHNHDYIFFLNSGALGPIGTGNYGVNLQPWTTHFLDLFTDEVKVVGVSVNCLPRPIPWSIRLENLIANSPYSASMSNQLLTHVQSYFFGIDREFLQYLDEIRFFEVNLVHDNLWLIANFEIALSQLALHRNERWTIATYLKEYRNVDFKSITSDPNWSSRSGDPMFKGALFGRTVTPQETIFFKSTRGILSESELLELQMRGTV